MQPGAPVPSAPPVVLPDPSVLLFPWYVWGVLIAIMILGTFIGTWMITRGWKE